MTVHQETYFDHTFDFRINDVPFDTIISHYESVNFLYPAKKKRIKAIMPIIAENWKKALQAKDKLLWIASSHKDGFNKMSTISLWRSTNNGWMAQHLTSNAGPEYVRNILIGTQLHAIENKYRSGQNWFQPTNRYANRIFGTIEQSIGTKYASVASYGYFFLPKNQMFHDPPDISIVRYKKEFHSMLFQFLSDKMGSLYVTTEEWDQDDIELSHVDELYKRYDLFRSRAVWLAMNSKYDRLAGVIIAYRGPLGLNFSLMENRIELILDDNLSENTSRSVSGKLFESATSVYSSDYPLDIIPVVIHSKSADILKQLDIEFVRIYNKSSWINKGFEPWCRHVANFFSILEQRFASKKNKEVEH